MLKHSSHGKLFKVTMNPHSNKTVVWLFITYLFIHSFFVFFQKDGLAFRFGFYLTVCSAKANIWDIVLVIQWRPQLNPTAHRPALAQGSIIRHFDSSNVSSAFVVLLLRRADGKQRKSENALHCAEDSCMFGISSQTVSVCCLVYFRASVAASSSGTILL